MGCWLIVFQVPSVLFRPGDERDLPPSHSQSFHSTSELIRYWLGGLSLSFPGVCFSVSQGSASQSLRVSSPPSFSLGSASRSLRGPTLSFVHQNWNSMDEKNLDENVSFTVLLLTQSFFFYSVKFASNNHCVYAWIFFLVAVYLWVKGR